VEHPFCQLFADKGGKLRLVTELLLHPALPMAILVEREPVGSHACRCWVARWDCDNPRIVPLPVSQQEDSRLSHFAFSPDGSWLVYRDNTEDRFDPVFVAVPVVPDAPLHLGAPVELGRCLGDSPVSTCWIASPLSFVVCDGAALYRWRLDRLGR
jgi:hypothetical protein